MGTIADKLNRLIDTKEGIRQEINRAYNTEEISDSDTFNSYIQKLEEHPYYLIKYLERTLESLKLSEVTSVGNYAFDSCTSLTEVSFPKVTSIGDGAFNSCTNLAKATFTNATTINSYGAFFECTSLTEVSFPNVTSIGDGAFFECTSLTEVSFPKVTSIGAEAFCKCTSLTSIYVGTNTSTVCALSSTSAFSSCDNLTNICVPASLVDSYKSATNWSSYADMIKPYEQPVE